MERPMWPPANWEGTYPLANQQAIGQWAVKLCQRQLSMIGALAVEGEAAVEGAKPNSDYFLDGPGGRVSANDGLIEAVIVGLRADLEAVGQSARWERIAMNLMTSHMAGYATRDLLSANIVKRDNWTTDLPFENTHDKDYKPIAKKSPPAVEPDWTREALTAVGIQNHTVLTPTIFSVWLWWTYTIGALDTDALDLTTTALSEMVGLDDWGLGRGGWAIADRGRLFLACAQINRCLTFVHALRGDIERASLHLAGNTYCSMNVKVEQLLALLRLRMADIDDRRVAAEADNGFYYRLECATLCTLGTRMFSATTNTVAAIPTHWNDLVDLATDYWAKEPRNAVWNTVVAHGITLEAAANLVFSTTVEVGELSMRSREPGGISHVFVSVYPWHVLCLRYNVLRRYIDSALIPQSHFPRLSYVHESGSAGSETRNQGAVTGTLLSARCAACCLDNYRELYDRCGSCHEGDSLPRNGHTTHAGVPFVQSQPCKLIHYPECPAPTTYTYVEYSAGPQGMERTSKSRKLDRCSGSCLKPEHYAVAEVNARGDVAAMTRLHWLVLEPIRLRQKATCNANSSATATDSVQRQLEGLIVEDARLMGTNRFKPCTLYTFTTYAAHYTHPSIPMGAAMTAMFEVLSDRQPPQDGGDKELPL